MRAETVLGDSLTWDYLECPGPRDRGGSSGRNPFPALRQFLFVSLRQREATYQLLRSVCKHLQVRGDGWGRGLHTSIAEHLPSSLLIQDSGQSPRDSLSNGETPRKSQVRPGNGGQEGTAGGGVVPAPWMGWAGCSDPWEDVRGKHEKPQPMAAQSPGPSLLVGDTHPIRSCPCPHGSGADVLGTHIMTEACPLSDPEPVRPGTEHPGAKQPP